MKIAAACVAVLLAVIGGCGVGGGTRPPSDSRFGAPVPMTPRDVVQLARDPCVGPLSPSEWASEGYVAAGEPEILATGERSCARSGRNGETLGVTVTPNRDALVDAYRVRQLQVFVPATISGMPAVLEKPSQAAVTCFITIGTAVGQGLIIDFTGGAFSSGGSTVDPCEGGQRIAEKVVAALPLPGGK